MENKNKSDIETESKKLSYEEIVHIANELDMKYKEAAKENYYLKMEINNKNAIVRLNYLFKIIENSSKFSDELINKCTAEIEESLFSEDNNKEAEE